MRSRLIFLIAVLVFSMSNLLAAPGQLDPTFNGDGKLLTNILEVNFAPNSTLEVQPDGKILAVTGIGDPNFSRPMVVRFNPNGTLDQTFGTGGSVLLTNSALNGWQRAYAMTLQPDGKILITGVMNSPGTSCATARLHSNGSLDTSFNGNGVAKTAFALNCTATAVKVQPDGKIVAGGMAIDMNQQGFLIMAQVAIRYNSNGTPDTGFGPNGVSATSFESHKYQHPKRIFLQSDGKILLASTFLTATEADLGLLRFNATGGVDTTFGNNGVATLLTPGTSEQLADAVMQADGKIVFADGAFAGFALTRVNSDCSLDASFGTGGVTLTEMDTAGATAIALQPDGKILLGGAANFNSGDFCVVRYNADGALDQASRPTFSFGRKASALQPLWGTGGVALADFDGRRDTLHSVAIDAAGRVVVAGDSNLSTQSSAEYKLALARFLGDASPYASVWGTVRSAGGLPIRNAMVTLSGGSLEAPVTVFTNNLGLYQFTGLPVTENYNVLVSAKRFRFTNDQQTFMLNQNRADLDFPANP